MNHIKSVDGELAIDGGSPARAEPIETTVEVSEHARDQVMRLLDTGMLSRYYNGDWAQRFEQQFAGYHEGEGDLYAVAVNSGTSALHVSVSAAGIGPGDEVIVPALCFVAAATAVVQNGAIPVICDAEPECLTLDLEHAKRLIGPNTRAILPVHFWGYPSNVSALRELCDSNGLVLIEDCAQALGATINGKHVGTFGDFATFAFSVRKHIACGEGGAVLCGEQGLAERLRSMSNYGKGPGWDDYESLGFSYRMAEIPAIVALDGLTRLDEEVAARKRAAEHYRKLFSGTGLSVVPEPSWGSSSYFKCPIVLPEEAIGLRSRLVEAISAENVSCRIPHRPLFSVPWLTQYLRDKGIECGDQQCPVAAAWHRRLFEIETGPRLPIEEAKISGEAVLKVWEHLATSSA